MRRFSVLFTLLKNSNSDQGNDEQVALNIKIKKVYTTFSLMFTFKTEKSNNVAI